MSYRDTFPHARCHHCFDGKWEGKKGRFRILNLGQAECRSCGCVWHYKKDTIDRLYARGQKCPAGKWTAV